MSKAKKKKNRHKPIDKPVQEPNRRSVLKGLGLLGSLAVMGGGGGLIYHLSTKEDEWGFLTAPVELNKNKYEHKNNINSSLFIPIGPEDYLNINDKNYILTVNELTPILRENNKKLGWTNKEEIDLLVRSQLFGRVIDNKEHSRQCKQYIKTAIDFLYNSLPNLKPISLELKILNIGDNYSNTSYANGKGFIGKTKHLRQNVIMINKKTNQRYSIPYFRAIEGSNCSITFDDETNEVNYRLFFGLGGNAIFSPFSEVIPLATHESFIEHYKKEGLKRSVIASETVSESISNILANEISEKLKILNGKKIISENFKFMLESKVGEYNHVPKAIEWMRKNGMQKGIDLYVEDPEKFMKAICS